MIRLVSDTRGGNKTTCETVALGRRKSEIKSGGGIVMREKENRRDTAMNKREKMAL